MHRNKTAFWLMVIVVSVGAGMSLPGAAEDGLAADDKLALAVEQGEGMGRSAVVSELRLLLLEGTPLSPTLGHIQFTMDVDDLIVETDRSELTLSTMRLLTETSTSEYHDAHLESLTHRDNHQLSIWPIGPQLTAVLEDRSCVFIDSAPDRTITRMGVVDAYREPNITKVGGFLNVEGCDGHSSLTLKGDFLLRLWEWDVRLTASTGGETLQSGKRNFEQLPEGVPDASYVAGVAQEQYIYAYNATLTLPRLMGHHEIFVAGASITAEDGFHFPKATGSLLGIPLDKQDVFAAGPGLTFNLTRLGYNEPILAAYEGGFSYLEIDGEPMDLVVEPMDRVGHGHTFWLFSGLVLAAFLVVSIGGAWVSSPELRSKVLNPVAQRRNSLFNEAIMEALVYNMDRPQKKLKWAKLAMALKPNHPEALAAMAEIYYYKRRYRKALHNYTLAIKFHKDERLSPGVEDDAVAFWAADCVRCLAMIRLQCRPREEREQLTDQIMFYVRMGASVDPDVTEALLEEPLVSDLWDSIRHTIDLIRIGARP